MTCAVTIRHADAMEHHSTNGQQPPPSTAVCSVENPEMEALQTARKAKPKKRKNSPTTLHNCEAINKKKTTLNSEFSFILDCGASESASTIELTPKFGSFELIRKDGVAGEADAKKAVSSEVIGLK